MPGIEKGNEREKERERERERERELGREGSSRMSHSDFIILFLDSCLTAYCRPHKHIPPCTHLLFLLDNISTDTQSHTERVSESSWKRFVRSPS